ncbi:MAG: DUF2191 domain-containing protein [Gemmatimonadota bacterium]
MKNRHTTLRLSNTLVQKAKVYARKNDITLTAVMERALSEYLAEDPSRRSKKPFTLPSFGFGGLKPGVNLDDTSALLDLMDGIE